MIYDHIVYKRMQALHLSGLFNFLNFYKKKRRSFKSYIKDHYDEWRFVYAASS